jgi:hypothetical protein
MKSVHYIWQIPSWIQKGKNIEHKQEVHPTNELAVTYMNTWKTMNQQPELEAVMAVLVIKLASWYVWKID